MGTFEEVRRVSGWLQCPSLVGEGLALSGGSGRALSCVSSSGDPQSSASALIWPSRPCVSFLHPSVPVFIRTPVMSGEGPGLLQGDLI